MTVKDLKTMLDDYEDNAEVIGVSWSDGKTFEITVGGDDEDEGSRLCRIGFE